MVDESMMRQVFYNLASNAFKAMPDGGTLTISLEGRAGKAHDPIRRYRGRYWRRGDETALRSVQFLVPEWDRSGLPIVYQIVTAHNGTISVRSPERAWEPPSSSISKCKNARKILIVDDERSIRELLEIFLKKEGFDVDQCRERRRRPGKRSRPPNSI